MLCAKNTFSFEDTFFTGVFKWFKRTQTVSTKGLTSKLLAASLNLILNRKLDNFLFEQFKVQVPKNPQNSRSDKNSYVLV